ncbi:MAG: class I adenylate-forming enzyme family protein, partial [Acidimicrobiia bacterium]
MPEWGDLQVDQLRFMARTVGDTVAYRDLGAGTAITFSEWDARSSSLARGLAGGGVGPGDRVSIFLPGERALDWIVAYAAVHKAGAVAVPTNTRLSVPELVTILAHAEVVAMFTCSELRAVADEVRASVPSLRSVSDAPFDDLAADDATDFQAPVGMDDLADVMYTSGTTGLPKGVAVRHRNVAMVPNNEPKWTGSGWLHGAPMFTFAGIAFIYNPMKLGLVGLYLPKFDVDEWFAIVERERPSWAFLVPAMAELIVAHPRFAEPDLSSLVSVSIGSAPLAPQTLLTLQERLPDATVSNSYGMTEAGPAFIVMPKDEVTRRVGSVGKAIGGMEMKIVDELGAELPHGEVGELLTRMPGRQREYYKDEAATAATWTDDGWLRSGDLAYLDEDGFLYIAGRKKDMIIRGGNNIYATDVEAVLLEHPSVQEAAVVGVPHPVLGEDVGAFVVLRGGATLSAPELSAFCEERLADYKRPRQITFVAELPRNATGKVMKHELAANSGVSPAPATTTGLAEARKSNSLLGRFPVKKSPFRLGKTKASAADNISG